MRVMTWNLWWRFGNWQERLTAIRAVLEAEKPDICGLQEVWADGAVNQAQWLAEELGMHWAFGTPTDQQPWRLRVKDPSVEFGVAVLSRWPITDQQVHDLPEDSSRAALSVQINAPHATIPFTTVHLSALPLGGSARRKVQLEWLAEHVSKLPSTQHPPIVTGDFNAEPESDEVRRFAGTLTPPVVDGQIFLDAWRYADPNATPYTWDRANPHVAAWIEPSSRIDYIHVVGRSGSFGDIQSARRAATSPVDDVWPSDHAAVIAELSAD